MHRSGCGTEGSTGRLSIGLLSEVVRVTSGVNSAVFSPFKKTKAACVATRVGREG